jgi:arsenite/tail-anchored protein-transporting ATPase
MRVLLCTGKGGVGKTTVAAATAVRCAKLGYRTIVLSADAAHSLADAFDVPLSGEPVEIADCLWAQEPDISLEVDLHWREIQSWMASVMMWQGADRIMAEELALLPGMEELANLLYVTRYHDKGDYDVLIIDCAPTAETLRLLSFPEVLKWWMEKLFPIGRTAASVTRPLIRRVIGLPMPEDKVFNAVDKLYQQLGRTHALLSDPKVASMRLVVNPENMVIREAQRAFTYLNLYGYTTDLVICNRLISEDTQNTCLSSWRERHRRYYRMIEDSFSPLPILSAPLMEDEIMGADKLQLLADALYADRDPAGIFFDDCVQSVSREDDCCVLALNLPFAEKGDVSLTKNGDELTVRVGSQRRNMILPNSLRGLSVKDAKFADERLRIRFVA